MYFILTFFLGAAVGSFVNVLIDRTMLGEDWVRGRSHCDKCKKTLAWYDMVPILSYVFYRGHSRCCHAPLTYRYPLVEAIVGLLFVWWIGVGFLFFQLVSAPLVVVQPIFWLMTGTLLAILALADLFYGVVLLPVVWIASGLVVVYRLTLLHYGAYQFVDLQNSILLSGIFYAVFWLLWKLTKGKGMADGDMYVALYMGLLLGWPRGVVALINSFILGALVGVFLIVTKLRSRHDTVPFVPFMVAAIIISLAWGEKIIHFLY